MDDVMVKKNPVLAGILSAIFIGSGYFYLKKPVKAVSYMALMATLIIAQVNADRAEHHVIIALLMSAFYFFQIYDAYQDAKSLPASQLWAETSHLPSKWVALTLIVVGLLIQLSNLGFLTLRIRDMIDFWPLVLIVLGLRMVTKKK